LLVGRASSRAETTHLEPTEKEIREIREIRVKAALAPLATNPDLRKAHHLSGEQLPKLLDEFNTVLAA
jgi:hypothetical protein